MPLVVCGLNHKTAPVAIREQVALSQASIAEILKEVLACGAANEAVIVSTCNRTEIYAQATLLRDWMHWVAQHPTLMSFLHSSYSYCHHDYEAIKHMMRVASGLDSMVLGEPQILGQLKQAFEWAEQSGSLGAILKSLMQKVFSVTKQVRTQTHIGVNPVSVAYIGVHLAKRIFSDLTKAQVLLVGAGQTIELAALHLSSLGVKKFIFANRRLEKAVRMADECQGIAIPLSEIPLYLPNVNIVISATSSPLPLFGKGMVERALKMMRKRRPLLMLDIAVPRDMEPEIAQLEDIYLYDIDHLQAISAEHQKSRLDAAEQAEAIIEIQAKYYLKQLDARNADQTICAYRAQLENLRNQVVQHALNRLKSGADPHLVLPDMARLLVNKILHIPSAQLRQAAFNQQPELLLAARKLLDL